MTGIPANKLKTSGLGFRASNMKAGWDKYFTGQETLTVGRTVYTVSGMDTALDSIDQLYAAVSSAESQLIAARTAVKAAEAANLAELDRVELALKGFFGVDNPALRDFGITL